MAASIFRQYIDKWFAPIARMWADTTNDERKPLTYLFKTMLRKEYSPTLKWEALSVKGTVIAADVVSMDSSLPLKKRDSLKKASGDIPKSGLKLFKGERDITDINIMMARGTNEKLVAEKIFNDTPRCITAIWERQEAMFLQGLSTGVSEVVVDDETEEGGTGLSVRVDYGYPVENKLKAANKWSGSTATPLTDIDKVVEKADAKGDAFVQALCSTTVINNMAKSNEGRMLYAAFKGNPIVDPTKALVPTRKQFLEAFNDKYGFPIIEVNRSVRAEKNGKQTAFKPFDVANIVFMTTTTAGALFYGTLAEETNPVSGVNYAKVDDYILVSKYSHNEPSLREFTSSQALVVPAIENVDSIYLLDTENRA